MQKNLYVRAEDESVWTEAEALTDNESLSRVVTEALRTWVKTKQQSDAIEQARERVREVAKEKAARPKEIADLCMTYLRETHTATLEELAKVVTAESRYEVEEALAQARNEAHATIASASSGNWHHEEWYPVTEGGGSWKLGFWTTGMPVPWESEDD